MYFSLECQKNEGGFNAKDHLIIGIYNVPVCSHSHVLVKEDNLEQR